MLEIKIPATSANMGPGFDCLGVALNLYNYFYIDEIESGFQITSSDEAFNNTNNLVYTSMQYCFKKIDYKPKGIRISINSSIPISRGLGSSAACILGGIIGANEIAGGILNQNEILEIATEIEGHPDNIAPALLGGMVISIKDNCIIYHEKITMPNILKFCALIPTFMLSTKDARAILPRKVDYSDCVFNIGRTSLLIAALANGNIDHIKIACQDKLHQPYRGNLIENYPEIIDKCNAFNSLGVFLSGSGPTIMNILREDDNEFSDKMKIYLSNLRNNWTVMELKPDINGATVKKY